MPWTPDWIKWSMNHRNRGRSRSSLACIGVATGGMMPRSCKGCMRASMREVCGCSQYSGCSACQVPSPRSLNGEGRKKSLDRRRQVAADAQKRVVPARRAGRVELVRLRACGEAVLRDAQHSAVLVRLDDELGHEIRAEL